MEEYLTGRRSHKAYKPFFGKIKLILIVEVRKVGYDPDPHGGRDIDITYWREAVASDLLIENDNADSPSEPPKEDEE